MVDDAELDRAVTHGPAAIRALGEADRLAGQRLGEINLGVAPANGAVGANSSQSVAGRILGLAQHAIPAPRCRAAASSATVRADRSAPACRAQCAPAIRPPRSP